MAVLHEAATQIAEGADEAATIDLIDTPIGRITLPPRGTLPA
jgi:hypothetical protein